MHGRMQIGIVVFEQVDLLDVGGPYEALLTASATLTEAGRLDLLVVPGAVRIDEVLGDHRLVEAIREAAAAAETVASVCTGAFVLQSLGFLNDRPWTTHWEDVEDLAVRAGNPGQAWVRWVDAGEVVTAGGLSSGIAMALHLVDRFAGRDLALRTARQIEYDWDPEAGRRT